MSTTTRERIGPVELYDLMGQLVERLSALVAERELEAQRRSEPLALHLGGQALNGVLWSGLAPVPAFGGAAWSKAFRVPYGSCYVSDPLGAGPLWIANRESENPSDLPAPGPGQWLIPQNGSGAIALTGSALSIAPYTAAPGGLVCVTVFAAPLGPSTGA
jgi:hypothetical protein